MSRLTRRARLRRTRLQQQRSQDTTKLDNVRHRLTVRAINGQGQGTEIGSVDFYTQNANPVP